MGMIGTSAQNISDQELANEVNKAIELPSNLKDVPDEILQHWHASLQVSQAAAQLDVNPIMQALGGTEILRTAANLKLEDPEYFLVNLKQC